MSHSTPDLLTPSPRPAPRVLRRAWLGQCALLAAALSLVLGGCGDPVRSGSGTLHKGPVRVLEIAGSPHDMGYWHGHLLRDEIQAMEQAWTRRNLAVVTGGGDGTRGASAEVLEHLTQYAETSLWQLPERVRQEVEGLSEGSGVSTLNLIRLGLLSDALRVHVTSQGPFLPGALAATLPEGDEPRRVFATWGGPDAEFLASRWILIHRKPDNGTESVALAWPGALGMLAGLSGQRREVLLGETASSADLRGFGRGVPVGLAARLAMERAVSVDDVFGETGGTSGHAMVVLEDVREDDARTAGRGAVLLYRGTQPWIDLDDRPWIVMGASQAVEGGLAQVGLWESETTSLGWDELVKRTAAVIPSDARGEAPVLHGTRTLEAVTWRLELPGARAVQIVVEHDGRIAVSK